MADMSLDELLSSSLKSAAEPAASAGVADAIRSRVASGDPGTSVAGITAPGWVPPRPRWFAPLVAGVAGLAALLAVLIAILMWPSAPVPEPLSPSPTVTPTASATPTATPTPTPTPTPTQEAPPPPPPPPPPAGDTTPPVIQSMSADPAVVGCGAGSTVTVTARDDTEVRRVDIAWSGPSSGTGTMSQQGASWTYFIPMNAGTGTYTITAYAVDAAGNASGPAVTNVIRDTCIG